MPEPTFQEQIDALITKFTPADKLADAKAQVTPLLEAMTGVFKNYATDIETAKGRLRALEGIKPEDFSRLETLTKEQKAAIDAKEAELTTLKAQYEAANAKLTETNGKLSATVKEKEIRKALDSCGLRIAADSIDEVYNAIDRRVVQKPDGTFVIPGVLVSKDAAGTEIRTNVERPIAEYITKEWAVTPFAKRVLLADVNTGGGAGGSGALAGVNGAKPWGKMTLTEQSAVQRADPAKAAALRAAEPKE